jgi:tRNA(fMet)-specific endonuclease VapC
MKKYLLDTNICIHFLKGEYKLKDKIKQVELGNCYFPEITILELLFGVENSAKTKKEHNRQTFIHFYNSIKHNIIRINSCFYTYAIEKTRLKQTGQLIGEFDMLIGCSAIANDITVVTRNTKHFERLRNIKMENWVDASTI